MKIWPNTRTEGPRLIRGLGFWAASSIVIGSMIGSGIFLVPTDVAQEVRSVPAVLAVWLVGGGIVLCGAFCYAELGGALPQAGGDYIYLSRGLGPVWGFLFGWSNAMIMRPASAAAIATGLARFAGFLWPGLTVTLFTQDLRWPFSSSPSHFVISGTQLLAVTVIVVVAAMNYVGIRTAGRSQILLTTLKIVTVGGIVGLGFMAGGHGAPDPPATTPPVPGGAFGFFAALGPVLAAYTGFQLLGAVGGEVTNPRKNLPAAAIVGTLLVIALYLSVNWAYFHVLGFSGVARSQHVASDTVARIFGAAGAKWFTVALIISAFGAVHAGFLAGPRVPYAMAREGQFFSFAGRVQPTFHSPSGAIIFQGCLATCLVLTGSYQDLYSYSLFGNWAFFALTALAVIRLRRTSPELERPFRVWGYPVTVLIFGAAALTIAVNVWMVRPVRSSIGLGIILLGVPFFLRWRRHAASRQKEESGLTA